MTLLLFTQEMIHDIRLYKYQSRNNKTSVWAGNDP